MITIKYSFPINTAGIGYIEEPLHEKILSFTKKLKYNPQKGSVYILKDNKVIGTDVGDTTFQFTNEIFSNLIIDYDNGYLMGSYK